MIVVVCGKKEKYVDSVQLYGELKKLNGVVIYRINIVTSILI